LLKEKKLPQMSQIIEDIMLEKKKSTKNKNEETK